MKRNKAVFLDRDGTIIKDMVYLNDPNQIFYFKDTFDALKLLYNNGFLLVLITNQSGVARGLVQLDNLHKINALIKEALGQQGIVLEAAYYCPHAVDAGCSCRKPQPGMIETAAREHHIDVSHSWMVGDRPSDVQAGRNAGCRSVLISDKPEIEESEQQFRVKSLMEAAQIILLKSNPLISK